MSQLRSKIDLRLRELLNGASSVSLNIAISSSRRMRGYLGVTVHFIDAGFNLQNCVLACTRFEGTHDASGIFSLAVEVIETYDLRKKVFFVGTDNGSNIVKAFKDWLPGFSDGSELGDAGNAADSDDETDFEDAMDLVDPEDLVTDDNLMDDVNVRLEECCSLNKRHMLVRCVARTLQLVLHSATKKCVPLLKVIEKLASTINSVKKSVKMTEVVEREFGRAFKSCCVTRWNSNFKTAQHVSEFDWDNSVLKAKYRLTGAQKDLLKEFVKLTSPFEMTFLNLQRDKRPAICGVIPFLYGLRIGLEKCLEDSNQLESYAGDLLLELSKRFDGVDEDELYVAAAFLDCKYKVRWCKNSKDEGKLEKVKRQILSLMKNINVRSDSSIIVPSVDLKRPAMLSFLDEISVLPAIQEPTTNFLTAEAELQLYLDDAQYFDDPLDFYRIAQNRDRFRRLTALAQQLLSAPATTAGVERMFSICGILLANCRLRTVDRNFETQIFCHVNLGLLDENQGQKRTLREVE